MGGPPGGRIARAKRHPVPISGAVAAYDRSRNPVGPRRARARWLSNADVTIRRKNGAAAKPTACRLNWSRIARSCASAFKVFALTARVGGRVLLLLRNILPTT